MNIIYIYDKTWTNNIAQIFDAQNIVANKKLNDFWYAEFSIPSSHPSNTFEIMRQFNEVRIAQNKWNWEQEIFHWYLKVSKAWWTKTEVQCRTFEHLLERKKADANVTVTQPLNTTIQNFLNSVNARYDSWLTLNCNITTSVALSYVKGESFLQVLKKLTDKYEFTCKWKVLYVSENVWIDRSIPDTSEYFQFKRDILEPQDRNVIDFSVTRDADDIANAIQWKSSWFVTDATSISTYWRIEDTLSNSDQNEAVQIAAQLEKRKTVTPKIELQPKIRNFSFAEVWDTVALYLNAWNELWQSYWTAKIYELNLRVWNLDNIDVRLSETQPYAQWILEFIRQTAKRVERLELQ